MIRISRGAVAALLALTLPIPLASAGSAFAAGPGAPAAAVRADAAAAPAVRLHLPRPTGPYAIGRDTLHLVDHGRKDPWEPSAEGRELMVSMYYPARPGTGRPAAYMSTEEARRFLERQGPAGEGVPPGLLSGVRTNTRDGARPVGGRHPLVVLSPGFAMNRATISTLAEELTSRGYVVALVDHAYETDTTFPGGRTLPCTACRKLDAQPDDAAKWALLAGVPGTRAKDVGFLLDRLLDGRHPAWKRSGLIDPRRIGMAGHSIGGAAAGSAMTVDRRIRAGADLDGTFYTPVPEQGVNGRPFLLLGTQDGHRPGADDTWDRSWAHLDGWKRWLTVAGAGHFTFTDVPALSQQAGRPDPTATIPGLRGNEITRAYVGAFFDQHLRGVRQPLLDGPTPAHPEVNFQQP
ncbi:alpha/beta hydrolase family protein [Streptomyces sp. NPDC018019]|uniref:alpha/beta hydrolase family protein n=1 Tax=Streptomyces sp. NPDC018019 TaxID=3365030 RepID=UPI003793BD1B